MLLWARLVIGLVRLPFGSTFLRCLPSRRGRWRCGSHLWNRSSRRRRCGLAAALRDIILFLDPLGLVLRLVGPPFILALSLILRSNPSTGTRSMGGQSMTMPRLLPLSKAAVALLRTIPPKSEMRPMYFALTHICRQAAICVCIRRACHVVTRNTGYGVARARSPFAARSLAPTSMWTPGLEPLRFEKATHGHRRSI